MNEPYNDELIRKRVEARWRRRMAWGLSVAAFVLFALAMVGGRLYRYFDPYGNVTAVVLFAFLGIITLQTVYLLVVELQERAVRRELERERRWQILERVGSLPEQQRTLTHLLLDDDGELLERLEAWQEKPKRHDDFD